MDIKRATIDWILANGSPMATFGPSGSISAQQNLRALARTGIDYNASTVGDLGGESWCNDTYDEATTVPGMWADIVPVGGTAKDFRRYPGARWFVPGEGKNLTSMIQGVLEAAQVGDLLWKIRVDDITQ